MTLADLTWEYRDLVFGEGCDVMVQNVEGFEGYEVRSSDSDQPRGDGAIRGLDYVGPRLVSFELTVAELEDLDGSVYEDLWSTIRATFRPSRATDYDLKYKRPGQPERFIRCRPISLTRSEAHSGFNRVGKAPVVLRAVDPRIYSTELHTGTVALYTSSSGGGASLPFELGVDFAAGARMEFVAENAGNADAYPVIQFYGPVTGSVTGVQLSNTSTGQTLNIDATIETGQILTADMDAAATSANRSIITLDGTTRYGDWRLPREAFALAPGSNTLRFTVTGTSTDAVCALSWRSTWLD